MIILDYILDERQVIALCERDDLLAYDDIDYDIVMPTRLCMNDVEVLGVRETFHQSNLHRKNLPSAAWNPVPILALSFYATDALRELRQEGHYNWHLGDPDLFLELRDEVVLASFDVMGFELGQASYGEVEASIIAFADRVRQDFIRICSRLCDHYTYGAWFRGEASHIDWRELEQQGYIKGNRTPTIRSE